MCCEVKERKRRKKAPRMRYGLSSVISSAGNQGPIFSFLNIEKEEERAGRCVLGGEGEGESVRDKLSGEGPRRRPHYRFLRRRLLIRRWLSNARALKPLDALVNIFDKASI